MSSTPTQDNASRHRKQLIGLVVSNKSDKTVVVEVERQVKHRDFHKYIQRKKKYMAHDEANGCDIGDLVMIQECRPLSRHKRWRVLKTVRKVVKV